MTLSDRALLPDIACVILAGGRSRRFGANKALATIRGARMIDLVIDRIAAQTSGPIAINASDKAGYDLEQHPFLSDRIAGDIGPLVGLHAALCWAEESGLDAVITTPVDTPMLPATFVAQLLVSGAPSIAQYDDQIHALHGIWPVALRRNLETQIDAGMRAARAWADACGAMLCQFPNQPEGDPFFNVNTTDDLSQLN